ncbi:MAG: tetratricopeptide repeat protein [Acidobacteriales bacterium]|nr:tetratricopeptide repeat protein [Terriglobales bacterium]
MRRKYLVAVLGMAASLTASSGFAQVASSPSTEHAQVSLPTPPRAEAPPAEASADQLERRGDELSSQKAYFDALDYYKAALAKSKDKSVLYNKVGMAHLQLQHFKDAKKNFEKSAKLDKTYAAAYNNIGVIEYFVERKYPASIKHYEKAIKLRPDMASYYSNLGAAYFAEKDFGKGTIAYSQALKLDPDVFERVSRTGISAQLSSPEDRARFEYELAKLYAKAGMTDRCLKSLRRAMEDGFPEIKSVYEDSDFAVLRKDPRFTELMASKPVSLQD